MNLFDLAMMVRPFFLVWMVAIFVYIAWRAWLPARRQMHHEHAMMPLRDDTPSPAKPTRHAAG